MDGWIAQCKTLAQGGEEEGGEGRDITATTDTVTEQHGTGQHKGGKRRGGRVGQQSRRPIRGHNWIMCLNFPSNLWSVSLGWEGDWRGERGGVGRV